ncbi:MAG: 50S ribosomal protein L4 [Pirellulales bacterium]|jgi:large subunit ribosomal protein L4|nr:50S ribosomal protein L4 [Pirellulales bacterium]HJN65872.1 50S ribosomal protein L4 [Pirellulales bacterium]|tara:strand:- start:77 stop:715 length:639 start_codon:yes stop_codon:yes gene_type:complete
MAKLPVYSKSGEKVGTYSIEAADLAPSINRQLLHDVVVMYQANRRQGSVRTKSRSDVSGSTKKMYRQKGTGNARAGSIRSGVRRGGGHIFARRPRDYSYRLPKKSLQLATRMAIASKILDDQLVIIDQLDFDAPATGEMAAILKSLHCDGKSVLVTTEKLDNNVYKSARNIDKVCVSPVSDLNALEVLRPKKMLVTQAALDTIKEKMAQEKE